MYWIQTTGNFSSVGNTTFKQPTLARRYWPYRGPYRKHTCLFPVLVSERIPRPTHVSRIQCALSSRNCVTVVRELIIVTHWKLCVIDIMARRGGLETYKNYYYYYSYWFCHRYFPFFNLNLGGRWFLKSFTGGSTSEKVWEPLIYTHTTTTPSKISTLHPHYHHTMSSTPTLPPHQAR